MSNAYLAINLIILANFYHLILDSGLLTPEEEVSAIDAKMRELKSLIRRER